MFKRAQSLAIRLISNPTYFWIILLGIYIISRIATWGYPFDSDHWIFYYVGSNWLDGGELYVTAWDHKPPLIFLFNGLMHLIVGGSIVLHRVILTILSLLDIGLMYWFLKIVIPELFNNIKKTINPDVMVKVSLILYVFLRNLSQFTSSGNNTENIGLIFVLAMMIAYLKFMQKSKWRSLILAGLFCSILFLLKTNFILLGLPIGIMIIINNRHSIKDFLLQASAFIAPIIIHVGLWVTYFYNRGTLADFWLAMVGFSAKYSGSAWSGDLSNNLTLIFITAILIIPSLVCFGIYLRDAKPKRSNQIYLLVGMMYLAGILLTIGVGSFYPYYFEIFMPFIVLILIYGAVRYPKKILIIAILASLILSYGVSLKQLYNGLAGSVKQETANYQIVADYVNQHTTIEDEVFCYDYGATFYRLSERNSGSRFISASVLLLNYRDNYDFGFNQIFIDEMDDNQTKYVITYSDRQSLYYANEPLVNYFDENYEVEKQFDELLVLRRTD